MSIDVENQVGAISLPGIVPEIGVTFINPNKILLLASLLEEGPFEPEVVPKEAVGSLAKLFNHFKPGFEIPLETNADGEEEDVVVQFDNLKAFRPDDLTKRIPLLQKLALKEEAIDKLLVQVIKSKKFRAILNDAQGEKKQALINVLKSVLAELG